MAQQNAVKQSAYSIQMVSQSTNCNSLMRMTQRTETLSSTERMRGICRHELFRNAFNPVTSLHVLTPRLTQLSAAFQWQDPPGARERVHWASQNRVLTKALTHTGGGTINNTITIVGYAGQNPHAPSFGDTGNQVVKFSVAVKEFSANTDESKLARGFMAP